MPQFAYRILPKRADFIATMTAMEGAVIERHWQHLQALFAAGRVNVVGRCENGASGLVVFEAPSFADGLDVMMVV